MAMQRYCYMKTTKDKYELPLLIADDIYEFAEILGTSVNSIRGSISHAKRRIKEGKEVHNTYHKVLVISDEEELIDEGYTLPAA